ncbi:hypothetical protein [Natrialba sp. INN-245]|uniref:hypothetical protein n=1 Tax=Natrialba sp. INN-245 TaxID=2690967 RepID=UPI0013118B8F|nr:hypothetical protein [Natrialba sp. INN-245]MWV41097.1 hypothetical protein [Natrialba sp. INN-245]
MAVHNSREEGDRVGTLPGVVPFSLQYSTRLSWELGSRSVQDEEATLLGTWTHEGRKWRLSLFAVTSETALIRVRTPVGRERFYGAIRSELDSALQELESTPLWHRID